MTEEVKETIKSEKIYDLDPLSVLDNATLTAGDHPIVAIREFFPDDHSLFRSMEEVDFDDFCQQRKFNTCLEEIEAILGGMKKFSITTGQMRLAKVIVQAIGLLPIDPTNPTPFEKLRDLLRDCTEVGACSAGQELGFSARYRRECQLAGVVGPPSHAERAHVDKSRLR